MYLSAALRPGTHPGFYVLRNLYPSGAPGGGLNICASLQGVYTAEDIDFIKQLGFTPNKLP